MQNHESDLVGRDEKVGHGISSSSLDNARKSSKVRRMVMNHLKGNGNFRTISTDRLTLAEKGDQLHTLIESADCRENHGKRWFQGWAVFEVAKILERDGFQVKSSPLRNHPLCPDNEYHADILLPSDSAEGQNWLEYVSDILNDWTWQSRPSGKCPHPLGSCNHP